MRDFGLQAAIRAVGGIPALARSLGVSQPAVSTWTKTPAERVSAVELATGVSREILRPDLFAEAGESCPSLADPIDAARAQLYLMFAHLLLRVPEERILIDLRRIEGDATELGKALNELAQAADVTRADEITREHFLLFVGVGRGELLPFASYYLTGFLYERPLVHARADMRRLGIERGEEHFEPEDHIGFMMEIMAGLITKRISAERGEERAFFEKHLKPWAERFFADLEKAEAAVFYRKLARVGQIFMAIEREAFVLEAEGTPDAA